MFHRWIQSRPFGRHSPSRNRQCPGMRPARRGKRAMDGERGDAATMNAIASLLRTWPEGSAASCFANGLDPSTAAARSRPIGVRPSGSDTATPHCPLTTHALAIHHIADLSTPTRPMRHSFSIDVQRGRHRWRSLAARSVAGRRVKPGQRTRCRSEARQIDAVEPGART